MPSSEHGHALSRVVRLQVRDWISAKWAQTASNRRARFYELMARGRRQLEKEQAEWRRIAGIMERVLE